jgi:hypothetical protein
VDPRIADQEAFHRVEADSVPVGCARISHTTFEE